MKATKRLISSVWTVEYVILNKDQVLILNYSREDPEGYAREHELPQCELEQAEGRIVTHLLIRPYKSFGWVDRKNATEVYQVMNPKHIFDYKSNQ